MPRVPKGEVQQHELYGTTKVDNNLTFGMRVRDRFRPLDTVRVHNITDKRVEWQWFDEQDESYSIEDDTNIKITARDEPGLWYIEPGEEDVLIGACAYLMIEALYKQICVMKTGIVLNPQSEREIRNFSLDDPERQELLIDRIFVGKLSPQDMQKAALESMSQGSGPKITERLTPLPTEQEEHARRAAAHQNVAAKPGQHRELSDLANEFQPGSSLLGTATGGLPDNKQPDSTLTQQSSDGEAADDAEGGEGGEAETEKPITEKLAKKGKQPVVV